MRSAYIVDLDLYVPDTYMDYKELSQLTGVPEAVVRDRMGIYKKPIERSLSVSEMAERAAASLLRRHGNARIDLVTYAGSDFKDKYVWNAAPKIMNTLGIVDAYGTDISMQCVSGIVALDLVGSWLKSRGSDSNALIVSATKQSLIVDYSDRSSSFMYDFSDGAAAVLLSNIDGNYRLLEGSILTDGKFSDVVYQRLGERFLTDPHNYLLEVNRTDEFNSLFEKISTENFINVIRNAVSKSGFSVRDISYLAILHMKRSFHDRILSLLGLPRERSIYLSGYGHMQAVDPFLSLKLAEERRLIDKGDIVVLVAAGTGWTWGAYVIQRIK